MKILVSVLLMAVIATFAVPGVWAHSEEGHVCFTEVDTDGDEKVTPEEFKKVYGAKGVPFSKGDKNGDGYIDHEEYENLMEGAE